MKRKPTEWENDIFTNHISNKRLMSRIYNEVLQLKKKQKMSIGEKLESLHIVSGNIKWCSYRGKES